MTCIFFQDVHHFQLWHGNHLLWYHTRLRPQTITFLEHISKLYELHICTFGVRMYAHTIARILDPKEKFFSHRILSRDECFDSQAKTANLKWVWQKWETCPPKIFCSLLFVKCPIVYFTYSLFIYHCPRTGVFVLGVHR